MVTRILVCCLIASTTVSTKGGDFVIAYSLLVAAPVACGDFSRALFCIYLHSQ